MDFILLYALVAAVGWLFFTMIRIIPEQEAWVLEELGKFKKTLGPGFHLVIPLMQRIAYKHSLKEEVIDVRPQVCITQDNVQVTVDGVLYLKVVDPYKSSYGIEDYTYATSQLAQTTMRSEIGKIPLDKTFVEREAINNSVVKSIDHASEPWGIKVTRYEIKDIEPSKSVIDAMEKQMEAERQKRAEILISEGEKESRINLSKGEREEAINLSRGERQRRINEADGHAKSIEILGEATAQGIGLVAQAIQKPHGKAAMAMQIADQYFAQLGHILKNGDVSVLPLEAAQLQSMMQTVLPQAAGFSLGAASAAPVTVGGKKNA